MCFHIEKKIPSAHRWVLKARMPRIETQQDREVLRQMALLLEHENKKLHAKIKALIAEVCRLKGEDATTAQLELEHLKQVLAKRDATIFGDSTERRDLADRAAGFLPNTSPLK